MSADKKSDFANNPLRLQTPPAWVETVLDNFDTFLQDHAAAEKKASGMALSMISHYPDKTRLVEELSELAVEELQHFKEVIRWLHRRGCQLVADTKDEYILAIRNEIRQGKEAYFLDRLITAGIIEARGCERFGLIAGALPEGSLQKFYIAITRSEQKHFNQFIELSKHYFPEDQVDARTDELLTIEANIVAKLPIKAALH